MGIQNRLWAIFLLGYVEKSTSADHIIWASPPNTQVFGYTYFWLLFLFLWPHHPTAFPDTTREMSKPYTGQVSYRSYRWN